MTAAGGGRSLTRQLAPAINGNFKKQYTPLLRLLRGLLRLCKHRLLELVVCLSLRRAGAGGLKS